MADPTPHTTSQPTGSRRTVLIALTILLGVATGALAAEVGLRSLRQHIESSDRLGSGLFRYDPRLGWRLTPGWSGNHRHYDYEAVYSVDGRGLRRGAGDPASTGDAPVLAVLGDSFTFGFGVGDEETFPARLHERLAPDVTVLNIAVPGYSTDQQALYLEDRVEAFKPRWIVVVVYLGNNLLDNMRAFPLQAQNGKPYFSFLDATLRLHNVPVPKTLNPPAAAREALSSAAIGDIVPPPGAVDGFVANLEIVRWLGIAWPPPRDVGPALATRHAPSVALFAAIVARMKKTAAGMGADLSLALLPGRSSVVDPESYAAQYQAAARQGALAAAAVADIPFIDLVPDLRQRADAGADLYYPFEGHLTPAGHAAVAEVLAEKLMR